MSRKSDGWGNSDATTAETRKQEALFWRDLLRRERDAPPRGKVPAPAATADTRARFARAMARDSLGRGYWDDAMARELQRARTRKPGH